MTLSRAGGRGRAARSALLALLVVAASVPTVAFAAPAGSRVAQGEGQRGDRAQQALVAAAALFDQVQPARVLARRAAAPVGADEPTLVMRDLAQAVGDLEGSDLARARTVLARPTDDRVDLWPGVKYGKAPSDSTCSEAHPGHAGRTVCVHWVTNASDPDAPALADADVDGLPDWVETNQDVFELVRRRVVAGLGYRGPLGDGKAGGDARPDVYLAELGTTYGMYGYCVPTRSPEGTDRRRAAYCVIDRDFREFSAAPLRDLQVTAAHEFFHAVQFGYQLAADPWLMEGTAAWVEDEVYDHINDNLQYLAKSPLRRPGRPLDLVLPRDVHDRYGSWIWWRFLGEYFGTATTPDPSVVRAVWQRLATDGPSSMSAMRRVIARRGSTFGAVFADFGMFNRIAPRWYEEGGSYARFVAPGTRPSVLTRWAPATNGATTLDHLSTRHVGFRPGRSLRGTGWRLRIRLDLPLRSRGAQARVTVHRRDGGVRLLGVRLDRRGDARLATGFGAGQVAAVVLSLTNASTRMVGCGDPRSPLSCRGWSRDDDLRFGFAVRAVRPYRTATCRVGVVARCADAQR